MDVCGGTPPLQRLSYFWQHRHVEDRNAAAVCDAQLAVVMQGVMQAHHSAWQYTQHTYKYIAFFTILGCPLKAYLCVP